MNNATTIVGADIGRCNSKIYCGPNQKFLYKSTATIVQCSDEPNSITVCSHEYNSNNESAKNTRYEIGKRGNFISNDDKSKDDVFHACLMYGLSKIENEFVDISIGLPIDHYKLYKNNLKEKYHSKDYIISDCNNKDKLIRIANCIVCPEARYCLGNDESNTTLIVDIGGLTLDIALFEDNEVVYTRTHELGVHQLYLQIAEKFSKSYGDYYTINDIEQAVRSNKIIKDNKLVEYDFTKYRIEFLKGIISVIRKEIGWGKHIPKFVGGGSIVFKDILGIKGFVVNDECIFTNAIGFYNRRLSEYGYRK